MGAWKHNVSPLRHFDKSTRSLKIMPSKVNDLKDTHREKAP